MDPSGFGAPHIGRAVRGLGPYAFYSFHPQPMPRAVELSSRTVMLLSEADRAVGRLAGAGRQLLNPHILIRPYLVREAVASSRIEGTQASLSEVFDAEAQEVSATGDLLEVANYVRAMELGMRLVDEIPISARFIAELHRTLMKDVRGSERAPGELRTSPNWIGSPDNRPETAVFVPPPVEEMQVALSDWERFIHYPPELPVLVRCALLHYQFETIHPFLDGNGRIGRLLIVLFLMQQGDLPQPLLYTSAYFEQHKGQYYDRLQAVRERGEVEEWLQFFLTAVASQASDALSRAESLADLREDYRHRLSGGRSRAHEVVDLLFENPVLTSKLVARRLGVTGQGALNLIAKLAEADIITELPRVPGRSFRWQAAEVLEVLGGTSPSRA